MENHVGFLSLIPSLLAIFLAIKTRQVIPSLFLGIFIGYLILSHWNPINAVISTLQALVEIFKSEGNTRTIIFTLLVGALIKILQAIGGIEGFTRWVESRISDNEKMQRKRIQTYASLSGLILFVESNISILTVGALFRSLFDKFKISREKLAYIVDSSSAPSCILIPFNAWGAYIMALLVAQSIDKPFSILASSIPFNFYAIITVFIVFLTIGFNKEIGAMRIFQPRAASNDQQVNSSGNTGNKWHMILPVAVMVLMMPIMLSYTGWNNEIEQADIGLLGKIGRAMGNGSGSASVLYSVSGALVSTLIIIIIGQQINTQKWMELTIEGMSDMVPMAILMAFAFAIGDLSKLLGTGIYISEITRSWLAPGLIPALLFLISAFIAFSTGTSWGTFAIMISIAVPVTIASGADLTLALAAVLGGGVFGDHCSPISDTTIISSLAAEVDHIDHVKTQLPYALIAGGITFVLYLILGILVF
ncbi:MAG TPA: Na+/H+ antiporter NhaC family protein [Cyclobacteriaceae bacterium]